MLENTFQNLRNKFLLSGSQSFIPYQAIGTVQFKYNPYQRRSNGKYVEGRKLRFQSILNVPTVRIPRQLWRIVLELSNLAT